MPIDAQPPSAARESPYSPAGGPPPALVFEQFQGMNTQPTRAGVPDQQAFWLDGFMPVAPRNLQTMFDVGTLLWNTGGTIVSFFFGQISNPYMVAILADGSVWAVRTDTAVAANIAVAGTIPNPSGGSGFAQYGNKYIIIVNNAVNGYFIWDGTTFFKPGDFFPPGAGNIPTAIGGTAVEIYVGHIWIAKGPTIFFSAPGSLIDFTTADGGGSFTSSDSFLKTSYVRLVQTNGLLYLIGDSSMNYISNVQTTGAGPIETTFTNQNADPEVGTIWPNAVQVWGRNILLANSFGVHISYGSAVTKVSSELDGVYDPIPAFTPSAAKAVMFGRKVYVLLTQVFDPISGATISRFLLWDGKLWWASSSAQNITLIATQEINSLLTAWGTDGHNVWPLFQNATTNITKKAISRYWDNPGYQFYKSGTRIWGLAQYTINDGSGLNVSMDTEAIQGTNFQTYAPTLTGLNQFVFPPTAHSENGVLLGLTVQTDCSDMQLISVMIDTKLPQYRG